MNDRGLCISSARTTSHIGPQTERKRETQGLGVITAQKVRDDQRSLSSHRETLVSLCELTHGHVLHTRFCLVSVLYIRFHRHVDRCTLTETAPLLHVSGMKYKGVLWNFIDFFFRILSRWKNRDVEKG